MTKIERLISAAKLIETAQAEIAFARGQIARAHSRPRTGTLVPRFETDEELHAWTNGWDDANAKLAS